MGIGLSALVALGCQRPASAEAGQGRARVEGPAADERDGEATPRSASEGSADRAEASSHEAPSATRGDRGLLGATERGAPNAKAGLEEGPIRVEPFEPEQQPPMFVMRGQPRGPGRLVFLHGMCGHAHGYAQSFQHSAAKLGTLISPQADILCGQGPWAKWSNDLEALDRRIVETFRTLGHADPIDDIVVIGYSQGATRAEALARRWPERYTRLVLMGAPQAPSGRGLGSLRAAVMMSGEFDRQDQMRAGVASMRANGVPSTFFEIPGARHGAMGPTPEATMGEALTWMEQNSKPRAPAADAGAEASPSGG